MSSKRDKIVLLKSKLAEMQNELQNLQKTQRSKESKSANKRVAFSPQRNNFKNHSFKNPTFWTSNPINHDDTFSPKKYEKSPSPTSRSHQKQLIQRSQSPVLKNIANIVDSQYYNSVRQHHEKPVHDISHFYQTAYVGKRFENSAFGMTRPSCSKEERKRTFEKQLTDTIRNPEKEKVSCRKIVKIIEKSPDKMLIQNPKSNPNMYFYTNRAIVLDRKGSMKNKNKSTLNLTHCASDLLTARPLKNQLSSKRKKSQKKHFYKYFEDTLLSHI